MAALCRTVQVSTSGYYAWKGRGPSNTQKHNEMLLSHIRQSFARSRQTYGSPRIWKDLQEAKVCCGKHRVARLMRQTGLRAVVGRRFRVTTDSKHFLPVTDNLLDRDFGAAEANVKWASDITYLRTGAGWLYLAIVLDLFSRRVVGWSVQASLDRCLVLNALEAALGQRQASAIREQACCTIATVEASMPARISRRG